MSLSLVMAPHPVLRTPAYRIDIIDETAIETVEKLAETMNHFGLFAISAPMIGISKNLMIVNMTQERSAQESEDLCVMINAFLLEKSEETEVHTESSPCFGGIELELRRSSAIKIRYETLEKKEIVKDFQHNYAAVIQHHLNILEGKSFFDQLSSLKKKIIFDRLLQRKKHASSVHVHGPHCRHS